MRHRKKVKKLGRTRAHRKSMIANMASSLVLNEYIVTTEAKAKACKSFIDRVVSVGKDKRFHCRRRVEQLLGDKLAADKLINVLAERFKDRVGGYVTMVRIGHRKGDDALMVKLILVGSKPVRSKKRIKVRKGKQKVTKREDKKTKDTKSSSKQGILDRVRDLRSKFTSTKKIADSKRKGQLDRQPKGVEVKSRSGI